ncbi:hypothetical protein [Methylobacterium oxalidis]|uniref:Uncharacterized protein n=1 Tax=Methylobacterium oxalidis TaxID=944322 RepID=A0A512J1J7_9HYPH|nr:hypothetical protein [Methylobacterium oxalidis]GEP03840.1 hypothetical protein MOX02_18780 [Methylobacterium oxalidis]GJE31286.1 hypothetical protein LDDCCGHA_1463 [Methylobacterium oxalidis]GLS65302.1 hypothetical protein GCM10007888_36840 [Methylobacterium oxalidis]
MGGGYKLDRPFTFSCPECMGAMQRTATGGLVQYRCHIGHVLTGEAMREAQEVVLEMRLGSVLSLLNERAELCRQLAEDALAEEQDPTILEAARNEALQRAETIRSLLESEWVQLGRDA